MWYQIWINILIVFKSFSSFLSGYMGTYTELLYLCRVIQKTLLMKVSISEKERFLDLEHLFPGQRRNVDKRSSLPTGI